MFSKRRLSSRMFCLLCLSSLGLAVLLFGSIAAMIFLKALPALNWNFLSSPELAAGTEGGIVYQIFGTLLLVATAGVLVVPLSLGWAYYQTQFATQPRRRELLSRILHAWNGVPSIVLGIVGYLVFVKDLDLQKSWFNGGVLLAILIFPTVTVSLLEAISALPSQYVQAARALGFSKSQRLRYVVAPWTLSGLHTGLMLGLSRAAGETAPIMFTAVVFSGAMIPSGFRDSPVVALPTHILTLAQDSMGATALDNAWGSAAVLLSITLLFAVLALPLRIQTDKELDS